MQMSKHPRMLGLTVCGVLATAAICLPRLAHAQPADATTLITEFKGETAAQTRTPDQLQAAYSQVLDTLLPDIGTDDLNKRGPAEDSWEKIALRAGRPGAEVERAAVARTMIAKLGPGTAQEGRLWMLKQIENIGRGEVVPTLVGLLNDQDALVKERARRALSNNPSPAASQALRAALATADTPAWRVAIIDALGYRKDLASVPAIAQLAGGPDPQVASTAVAELSAIGGPDAVRALQMAKGTATGPLRKNVIDALLLSADRMNRMGTMEPAAAIYQSLYVPGEARGVRIAALRGLVVARGARAIPTLTTVLSGDDDQMRVIASRLTGEISGPATTRALAALVPGLPTAGQIALLNELGDRGDAAARPALIAAAKSPDNGVQLAALRALGQIGTAADVAFLAQTAAATPGATADAARASLAQLHGTDVNPALVQDLAGSTPKIRAELIRGLTSRRYNQASAALLPGLQDPDAGVRASTVSALGVLGDAKVLPALVTLMATTQDAAQQASVSNAVGAIINTLPDKTVGATPILAALPTADAATQRVLLGLLKYTGGAPALDAVRADTKSTDADTQDAAIRILADWPDPVATTDLLQIARTDAKPTHKIIALRGVARMASAGARPAAEKVQIYRDALGLAQRPDEKRLILAGLADVSDPNALKLVSSYLTNNDLKEEAAAAAVKIGKNGAGAAGPDLKPVMRQVIATSKNQDTITGANEVLNLADVALRGWQILGPFAAASTTEGFDKNYGPETGVDLSKTYPGAGGKTIGWKPAAIQPSGLVALETQLAPNENVVGYASVYVKSPNARKAIMSTGSDDGIKAWLNGKQVIANNANRPATPDADEAPVELKAGWNQVLLKITQGGAQWGYYFDLLDPQKKPMNDLVYAARPQG